MFTSFTVLRVSFEIFLWNDIKSAADARKNELTNVGIQEIFVWIPASIIYMDKKNTHYLSKITNKASERREIFAILNKLCVFLST